jgi:hypothetical protein
MIVEGQAVVIRSRPATGRGIAERIAHDDYWWVTLRSGQRRIVRENALMPDLDAEVNNRST